MNKQLVPVTNQGLSQQHAIAASNRLPPTIHRCSSRFPPCVCIRRITEPRCSATTMYLDPSREPFCFPYLRLVGEGTRFAQVQVRNRHSFLLSSSKFYDPHATPQSTTYHSHQNPNPSSAHSSLPPPNTLDSNTNMLGNPTQPYHTAQVQSFSNTYLSVCIYGPSML